MLQTKCPLRGHPNRGVACDIFAAIQVARLSVMRVQVPKSEKKVKWFDFGVDYFDKCPTPGFVFHFSEQIAPFIRLVTIPSNVQHNAR